MLILIAGAAGGVLFVMNKRQQHAKQQAHAAEAEKLKKKGSHDHHDH